MNNSMSIDDLRAITKSIIRCIKIEGYEYEDLLQEGLIAGIEAIEKYDDSRNIKLSTFVYNEIKYKIYYFKRSARAKKRQPDLKLSFDAPTLCEEKVSYGEMISVAPTQEEDYMFGELKKEVMDLAKERLKPDELDIIMKLNQGISIKELAEELEVDSRKLGNKISYIKRKMRDFKK